MSERVRGVIVRDITARGFGFARETGAKQQEHFFHYADCDFNPELGMEILFEVGFDRTGRTKCINITRASETNENQN